MFRAIGRFVRISSHWLLTSAIPNAVTEQINNLSLVSSWLFTNQYIMPQKGWSIERILRMPIVAEWINERYSRGQCVIDESRNRTVTTISIWLRERLPTSLEYVVTPLPDLATNATNWLYSFLPLPLRT